MRRPQQGGGPSLGVRCSPLRRRNRLIGGFGLKHPRRPIMAPILEQAVLTRQQELESELCSLRRYCLESRQKCKDYKAELRRQRENGRKIIVACALKLQEKEDQLEELQRLRLSELSRLSSEILSLKANLERDKIKINQAIKDSKHESHNINTLNEIDLPDVPTPVSSPDSSPDKSRAPKFFIRPPKPPPPPSSSTDDLDNSKLKINLFDDALLMPPPLPPPPMSKINSRRRLNAKKWWPEEDNDTKNELELLHNDHEIDVSDKHLVEQVDLLTVRMDGEEFGIKGSSSSSSSNNNNISPKSTASSVITTTTDEGFSSCQESDITTTTNNNNNNKKINNNKNDFNRFLESEGLDSRWLLGTSPGIIANHCKFTKPSQIKKNSSKSNNNNNSNKTVVYWKGPFV